MKKIGIFFSIFLMPFLAYAHEFTLVYTGNSYSTLYSCGSCPASVGGGIARRAAKIKDIRKKTKNVLLLDSGNFTAAGPLDQASISPEMDKKRSVFYYGAMDAIGYDAANLGEAEFNLGLDFIKDSIKTHKFKFISANVQLEGALPYYIKDFKSFKIAVIGLGPQSLYKKAGVKVEDYEKALKSALEKIKNKADFIILASSLGDEVNLRIAEKFKEIKVIISAGNNISSTPQEKVQDTIILRPSYRAQELRMADFNVKSNKIIKWEFKKENLSLDVVPDAQVKEAIPACFRDNDCPRKEGLVGRCQNPGELKAVCTYYEPKRIEALLITDTQCPFCSTEMTKKVFKNMFLGIEFKTIDYRDKEASELIKKYSLNTLPSFILPNEIKNESGFEVAAKLFEENDGKFLAKKEVAGLFLLLTRKEIPKRIDFFFNPYEKDTDKVLSDLLQFQKESNISLNIHFIVPAQAVEGYPQEELKVALALKKLFPEKFTGYLTQRLKDIRSASCIDSLTALGLDYKKVIEFSKSKDMESLIKENTALAEEIGISDGNVILINNNRIFKVFQVKAEDLKKFF